MKKIINKTLAFVRKIITNKAVVKNVVVAFCAFAVCFLLYKWGDYYVEKKRSGYKYNIFQLQEWHYKTWKYSSTWYNNKLLTDGDSVYVLPEMAENYIYENKRGKLTTHYSKNNPKTYIDPLDGRTIHRLFYNSAE